MFKLSQEQTQIIDSLLVYMQNKVDLINIETEKIEYYYLHPFSRFPYYSQIIVSYLCQLFLSLAEQGTLSSVSSVPDAITFRNAINFLNTNLDCQPTVSEIAEYCNISDASLKRIFDKYAGISVHKYLLKLKINVAKNYCRMVGRYLLLQRILDLPVKVIFQKHLREKLVLLHLILLKIPRHS